MDGPFKNEYIGSCLLMHRVRADEWNDRKIFWSSQMNI